MTPTPVSSTLLVVAAIVIAWACSGEPTQKIAEAPSGSYASVIQQADLPPDDSSVAMTPASWIITFHPDGVLEARADGQLAARGKYDFRGNELLLAKDDKGPCVGHEPGSYRWEREGEGLRLEKQSDSCKSRSFVLTRHTWKLRS